MFYVAPEERSDLLQLKGNTDLSYDNLSLTTENMNQDMRFPTMWYVRPVKPQISLRLRPVWSEHLLVAWLVYEC